MNDNDLFDYLFGTSNLSKLARENSSVVRDFEMYKYLKELETHNVGGLDDKSLTELINGYELDSEFGSISWLGNYIINAVSTSSDFKDFISIKSMSINSDSVSLLIKDKKEAKFILPLQFSVYEDGTVKLDFLDSDLHLLGSIDSIKLDYIVKAVDISDYDRIINGIDDNIAMTANLNF